LSIKNLIMKYIIIEIKINENLRNKLK